MGNDFQVHRVSLPGTYIYEQSGNRNGAYDTLFCPQADIQDWFKFRGTATQEALLLIADTQTYTTLATPILASASPTQIDVVDASNFNASGGFVSIGDEIFQYTAVSGNSLTGITRAKYSTTARSQYTGDNVYQCLWFTVINGGALLCGYQKPS